MKLFIAFLSLCFIGGLFFWRVKPGLKNILLLAGILFMTFAYYFLHQF